MVLSINPVDVVQHLLPQQPNKSIRTKHQPAMPWEEIRSLLKTFKEIDHYDATRRT